jgi:hypothetical protein
LLGVLALASLVAAGQDKKDEQVVSSKGTTRAAASSVNFRKDLGLSFPSLGTLGPRVDAARRAHDPVALAHAASELAVAEQVSGKTASVTSKQLIQESAELASLRRQEAELNAVLKVSNQVRLEEDKVASLKNLITETQAMTKAARDSFQRKEEPQSNPRQVVVNNFTPQYFDIWVNGSLKTQVPPGQSQVITIEHRWNPTVLTAYGDNDTTVWGPRYIWGEFKKYTWNIE